MGKHSSVVASTAAVNGSFPSMIFLWIFSKITMASSTTNPMDNTKAANVAGLKDNFKDNITVKVPIMDTGTAMAGTILPSKEKVNNNTINRTKIMASIPVALTF